MPAKRKTSKRKNSKHLNLEFKPNKTIRQLQVGEKTSSSRSSRFKGLPVGRTKEGFVIMSRVTSKPYKSLNDIPASVIKKVESFA